MFNEKEVGRKAGMVSYQRAEGCCFSRILPTPQPWEAYRVTQKLSWATFRVPLAADRPEDLSFAFIPTS